MPSEVHWIKFSFRLGLNATASELEIGVRGVRVVTLLTDPPPLLQAASQHNSAMWTTEGVPSVDRVSTAADVQDADMTTWTEAEFEEKCTYIVYDSPMEGSPDRAPLTRAEASLPRNLLFRHPAGSAEVGLSLTGANNHSLSKI